MDGVAPLPANAVLSEDLEGAKGERRFAEPWEARAFAIVVEMSQAGHFSWPEWVECFAQEVASNAVVEAAGGRAKSYYEQWLDAAETLLAAKGLASREQLAAKRSVSGAADASHRH